VTSPQQSNRPLRRQQHRDLHGPNNTVIVNGDGYSEVHAEGGGQTVVMPSLTVL
jgi:hypothetical protein